MLYYEKTTDEHRTKEVGEKSNSQLKCMNSHGTPGAASTTMN